MNDEQLRHPGNPYDDVTELWNELEDVSTEFVGVSRRKDRQLNVRVDEELLAALRRAAQLRGEGYHSLARRYVENGVAQDLATLEDLEHERRTPFQLKEAMLVLVGADGANGHPNEPIDGKMRLQKLLFLMTQHLRPDVAARFEAHNFGPFDDAVSVDLQFLAGEGLIEPIGGTTEIEVLPPGSDRGDRILEWIRSRNDKGSNSTLETYRLTQKGLTWVERFFASEEFGSAEAKERLAAEAARMKRVYGHMPLEDLVEYVYQEYPEFTARSKIRHEVAERAARKRARATERH